MDKNNIFTIGAGISIAVIIIFIGVLFQSQNLIPLTSIFENAVIRTIFILLFGVAAGYYTSLLFNKSHSGSKYWLSGLFLTMILFVFLGWRKVMIQLNIDSMSIAALIIGFIASLFITLSKDTNKIFLGKAVEKISSYIFNSIFMLFASVNFLVPQINIIFHFNENWLSWTLVLFFTAVGVFLGKYTEYKIELNVSVNNR